MECNDRDDRNAFGGVHPLNSRGLRLIRAYWVAGRACDAEGWGCGDDAGETARKPLPATASSYVVRPGSWRTVETNDCILLD